MQTLNITSHRLSRKSHTPSRLYLGHSSVKMPKSFAKSRSVSVSLNASFASTLLLSLQMRVSLRLDIVTCAFFDEYVKRSQQLQPGALTVSSAGQLTELASCTLLNALPLRFAPLSSLNHTSFLPSWHTCASRNSWRTPVISLCQSSVVTTATLLFESPGLHMLRCTSAQNSSSERRAAPADGFSML